MPTSFAGTIAMWTYLVGYWCYLFLAGIAAWPRLSLTAWFNYIVIQALCAVLWPILVEFESFGFWR